MVSALGKALSRIQGIVWGDQVRDSSVYLDGHTVVQDVVGPSVHLPASVVRRLDPLTNAPVDLFTVYKDGAVSWSGPPFDVTGFGAVGDGLTDDGPAIRATIAAACAAGGGTVLFPGGPSTVYLLGSSGATFSLTLCTGLTLLGEGAVLRRDVGNTEQLLGATAALSDVRVAGLTLDNRDALVFSGGVLAIPNGSTRITLERCRIVGMAYATALALASGPTQSSHVRLVDCSFERTLATSSSGGPDTKLENVQTVELYDCSSLWVERCRFDNVGALYLVALDPTACPTTNPMSHVYLLDCVFTRIKTTCVFATPGGTSIAAMDHVVIAGNSFLNVGKELEKGALAIGLTGTMTGVHVRGNTVKDWGYAGSSTIGASGNAAPCVMIGGTANGVVDGVVVAGNHLDAASLAGVVPPAGNFGIALYDNVTNAAVVGNTIRSCGYAGMRLQGSASGSVRHVAIAGNVVQSCALRNDATSLGVGGGIHLIDYAAFVTITGNHCVDNGSGSGASGQAAGIAINTPTSSAIADLLISGNRCTDTRAGGARTQLYGIRVGSTGGAAASQPSRVTLAANDVVNNATAGLFYQTTVDLNYLVAGNRGENATTPSAWVLASELVVSQGNGARLAVMSGAFQGLRLGASTAVSSSNYNVAADANGLLLLNALTGQTISLRVANTETLAIGATGAVAARSIQNKRGTDVAAANDLVVDPASGDSFLVSGSTTINRLSSVNWQDGAVVRLIFTASVTVTNMFASGESGQLRLIRLAGSVNFAATQFDTLSLQLVGSTWYEIARAVI